MKILENYTRVSQLFVNVLVVREAQFDSSECFCWSCKGDKSHWTVRCRACLLFRILSFKPTWPFLIVKIVATQAKFLKPSSYCTVINYASTFYATNVFSCFHTHKALLFIRLYCIFICSTFKSCLEWTNAHISTPTATIIPTTMTISYGLNYFGNMIYISQTSMY